MVNFKTAHNHLSLKIYNDLQVCNKIDPKIVKEFIDQSP
jgi:hypothetical protein